MELRLQKTLPTATAGRMAALEAVGLVTGADIEIEAVGFDGKPNGGMLKVKRYTMTDAAKPFARTEEVERFGAKGKIRETRTDLCWGKKVLHNVVKWEGPRTSGDYQEALVQYQYKIDGLADWAKKPEFLVAFPGVGRMVDDPFKKEQHVVKLTNLGWEAAGLDN